MNIETIQNHLRKEYPSATERYIADKAVALSNIDASLYPNLMQWIERKTFSDIWVHKTYCLRTVLAMWKSSDVCSALLALDTYLHDSAKEAWLFRVRG